MIVGESFETTVPGRRRSLQGKDSIVEFVSVKDPTKRLRHCDYQAFATTAESGNPDFSFSVEPALNKVVDAVSFRSVNFPTKFLTSGYHAAGVEVGRVFLSEPGNDLDSASFSKVKGTSSASVAFLSLSKNFTGQYLTFNGQLSGGCAKNYDKTCSDVALVAASDDHDGTFSSLLTSPPIEAQWTLVPAPAPTGPYDPWMIYNSSSAQGTVERDHNIVFNGQTSARIEYTSGTGLLGYSNRGLGREGLFLEAGKDYEGYFFAKSSAPVDITVRLQDYTSSPPTVLATDTIAFKGGNWTMLKFKLFPTQGTTCDDGQNDPTVLCGKMANSAGHICIKCGGEFVIGIDTPSSDVNIDYVYFNQVCGVEWVTCLF
jgi:hypothetical protein